MKWENYSSPKSFKNSTRIKLFQLNLSLSPCVTVSNYCIDVFFLKFDYTNGKTTQKSPSGAPFSSEWDGLSFRKNDLSFHRNDVSFAPNDMSICSMQNYFFIYFYFFIIFYYKKLFKNKKNYFKYLWLKINFWTLFSFYKNI